MDELGVFEVDLGWDDDDAGIGLGPWMCTAEVGGVKIISSGHLPWLAIVAAMAELAIVRKAVEEFRCPWCLGRVETSSPINYADGNEWKFVCPRCRMGGDIGWEDWGAPCIYDGPVALQSVSPRTWQDIAIDVRPYLPGPFGVPQVAVTARRAGQHSMGPGMVIVEGDATTLTDEQLAEAAGQAVAKLLAAEEEGR